MSIWKSAEKLLKKTPGVSAARNLMGIPQKKEMKREVEFQRNEAASQRAAIDAQGRKADDARRKMSMEKSTAEQKVTMGRRAASRRRVRGGLFGDSSVDQNTQARLG